MSAQSAMQGLAGTVIGGAVGLTHGALKFKNDLKGMSTEGESPVKSGISPSNDGDLASKKAEIARNNYKNQIRNMLANKELSDKAKSRRLGKMLDNYANEVGGKK